MAFFNYNGFPLQAHDPEELGAGTRRPRVPQEIARLQRRSFYEKEG
ncbi:hypothetical protein ACQCVP_02090 [Rossellomorea vietnamensis]